MKLTIQEVKYLKGLCMKVKSYEMAAKLQDEYKRLNKKPKLKKRK